VDQTAIPVWAAALIIAWLIVGATVIVRLIRGVAISGGKAGSKEFQPVDLVVCVAILVWFGLNVFATFTGPDRPVTYTEIVDSAVLYVGMVGALLFFLQFRGIPPLREFGLLSRNPLLCIPIAGGLLLCSYPLVALAEQALNGKGRPQNIVEYFLNASQGSDNRAVYMTIFMAVVVAPVAEETIFRGYLYGVLKRYAGGVVAALITAGMFAAMHGSLSALPPLFVLALCLTLAYEATGSLLVNIFMHSMFNLGNLLLMLWSMHHSGLT
jgi:membrane protease YdiL (CAAX protease family)